jgi:DNA polymerase-3 subunit alpha
MTRRGKMAIVMLDDGTAQVEVTVYNELFEAHRDILKEDRPLVIQGKVAKDEFTGGLRVVAEKLMDLRAARERFARQLRLSMNGEASAARLRQLLEPYRNGTCPVAVRYVNGTAVCEVRLGDAWRVSPDDTLVESLSDWLKPENVEFLYA